MSSIDFSRPRRMSGSALVILFFEFVLKAPIANLVLIILLVRRGGSMVWFIPAYLTLMILSTIVRFLTLRYYVADGILYAEKRFYFWTNKSSIPIDRIHNVSEKSNFLYQMTDMVMLKVDSTASQDFELELILTLEEAKQFRALLAKQEELLHTGDPQVSGVVSVSSATVETEAEQSSAKHIRYDVKRLFRGIVTQSHARSIVVVGSALLAVANEVLDFLSDNLRYWLNKAFDYGAEIELESVFISPWHFLLTALGIYVLLVVVWTLVHLVKLWDTKVSLFPRYISYSAGLITNRQKRIRASQIIAMSFKENPLERLTGQCTLNISQAEAKKKEEKEMGGNGLRVFGWREEQELMQWWGINPRILCELAPGKRMLDLWVTVCLVVHIIAGVTIVLTGGSEWLVLLVPSLAFGLWWAMGAYYHRTFALTPTHLYVRHGGTAEMRSWVPYGRIDKVQVMVSPIQRMSGRCSLIISAMDNQYTIGFIKQEEASALRDKLLYLMER